MREAPSLRPMLLRERLQIGKDEFALSGLIAVPKEAGQASPNRAHWQHHQGLNDECRKIGTACSKMRGETLT